MKISIECDEAEKEEFISFAIADGGCPFLYTDTKNKDCLKNADCRECLNKRIKWKITDKRGTTDGKNKGE